jgi:hypothetical protein
MQQIARIRSSEFFCLRFYICLVVDVNKWFSSVNEKVISEKDKKAKGKGEVRMGRPYSLSFSNQNCCFGYWNQLEKRLDQWRITPSPKLAS